MSGNEVKAGKFNGEAVFAKIKPIMIPAIALIALLLFNVIRDPSFFVMSTTGDGVLTGTLISVIDEATELVILTIGMTLVTAASGGQDISVGATMALVGGVIIKVLLGDGSQAELQNPVFLAFLIGCLVAMAVGLFNGVLVAFFKIQPMIATLIMFTAGRSIAAWVNQNSNFSTSDVSLKQWGTSFSGVPIFTPILISIACFIIIALVLKFTTLGLYTQAVGINESSSRLNGINPKLIKLLAFIILGFCAGIAGFVMVSRQGSINYSGDAKNIEMDAILAVAIGGNALAGGKFSMVGSVMGAYVIQLLDKTLNLFNIGGEQKPAYKAVVVILLVVFSSETVREKLSKFWKKVTAKNKAKEVGTNV